ncbi:hypothetical protein M5K25_007773 [Dendrobium thyrsiflorum]|uniref:Uncharacterized protein n=1 Tax=Dendrobium thyrsiflorum TaxID=117978 RepID=A0ABD0VM68_DENTH
MPTPSSSHRASVKMQSSKFEMADSLFKPTAENDDNGIIMKLLVNSYTSSKKRSNTVTNSSSHGQNALVLSFSKFTVLTKQARLLKQYLTGIDDHAVRVIEAIGSRWPTSDGFPLLHL